MIEDQTGAADTGALPDTVTLHGRAGELRLRLIPPPSIGLRSSLAYAVARADEDRVYAAALWHCSATIRQHVRDPGKVAILGSAVLDYLIGQGVPYVEAYQAGQLAWVLCIRDLPDWSEVKRAAGFTDPATGGSTL